MNRLTQWDENKELIVREEEWLLNANGLITKDEMYKIMRHLAERLSTYEDIEEQGLLLMLPCKIGSTVWFVGNDFVNDYEVIRYVVDKTGAHYVQVASVIDGREYWSSFSIDDIGKTVFLTKEEAEQALKQIGE